jgi:hypothetical protein
VTFEITQPETMVLIYENLEVGEILETFNYFFNEICCYNGYIQYIRRYIARYLSLLLDTVPHKSYYIAKTRSISRQASFTVGTY